MITRLDLALKDKNIRSCKNLLKRIFKFLFLLRGSSLKSSIDKHTYIEYNICVDVGGIL